MRATHTPSAAPSTRMPRPGSHRLAEALEALSIGTCRRIHTALVHMTVASSPAPRTQTRPPAAMAQAAASPGCSLPIQVALAAPSAFHWARCSPVWAESASRWEIWATSPPELPSASKSIDRTAREEGCRYVASKQVSCPGQVAVSTGMTRAVALPQLDTPASSAGRCSTTRACSPRPQGPLPAAAAARCSRSAAVVPEGMAWFLSPIAITGAME